MAIAPNSSEMQDAITFEQELTPVIEVAGVSALWQKRPQLGCNVDVEV